MPTTLEPETEMGRVTTQARIENMDDLVLARKGVIKPSEVRSIEVSDALVDTGCTVMGLPKRIIEQLGLDFVSAQPAIAVNGITEARMFGPVRLTIAGRSCPLDAMEVSDSCPVVIGQIPLEYMDFVVDPRQQKLIGNPAHRGEQMFEMM